jgi:hypothetical protein
MQELRVTGLFAGKHGRLFVDGDKFSAAQFAPHGAL